jgi:transposase
VAVVVGEWKKATKAVATLEEARKLIEVMGSELDSAHREVAQLRHRVDQLCRAVFGRRSEKGVVVEQGVLPFVTAAGEVAEDTSDEQVPEEAASEVRAHQRRHRGRRPLPDDLPREEVEIVPDPRELVCTECTSEKVRIGSDRTEELDYQPASFFIREYVRPKYACPSCQSGVVQAALPARPIEKGRPGPGLLAHVVTSKYADHLPLYRIEQILGRQGIEVSRRTLSEWNGAVADLLAPIVAAIKKQILASQWIQCDDTGLEVQDPEREPAYRQGHLWVYRGSRADVVYDFTWQRNRDGPMKMLESYAGYLQADAAPAFNDLFLIRPIVEVGCWAHARRYFKEAVATAAVEATRVLLWIGELYGIERSAREKRLDAEARKALRQQQSRPILDRIRAYLDELAMNALPKSPLGEATVYASKQWTALTRYLEHGALEIDNNGAENALRPIVLGRKNWLFCGSETAAHRAAILCSLVNTCKAHQVNPFTYLRDVIERISTHPASRVEELTPRIWKELQQQRAAEAA